MAPPEECIDRILDSMVIPKTAHEHKQTLEREIILQEIGEGVGKVKLEKAPCLDGLTSEFYKKFKDLLSLPPPPHLQLLFRGCLEDSRIPDSWKEVGEVLISKGRKDLEHPQSYRSLAVLNTDYKIVAILLV